MLPSRFTSFLILLVVAGCLKPGPLPEGCKLAPGRDIGGIGFVSIDGATQVRFDRRKAPATASKGAVSDLWIVPWHTTPSCDGTQPRLVVANRSDRWGEAWAGGSFFTVVDEQQVTSGGVGGGQESVGTLVRIDSHFQPNVSFENVSNFAPYSDNRLLYRQVLTNGDTPGLFLWDGENALRLGDVASVSLLDMQFGGSGLAYFVLGTDRVLSRLDKLTDTPQPLHANVSRFQLRADENYIALSLSLLDASTNVSTTKTVVLDAQAGKDIPLARPNPCCWLGFTDPNKDGSLFTYSQSASGATLAEYHTLDLVSGVDTTLVLPAPLVDLKTISPRPHSDEDLYLDSQDHGVFFGHTDKQPRRAVLQFGTGVPVRMVNQDFSDDGQYLTYIDPQPITETDPYPHGPLMVQDADLVNPPRRLTTTGMTVAAQNGGYGLFKGNRPMLYFWAWIVRGSSDLYFANYETGDLQVVASAIGYVQVLDLNQIVGTVNVSAQDNVGDLVVKDVRDNSGARILAHAAASFTLGYGLVAYTVRGRVSSDHDGLWGTTLAPPGQDGGP